MTQVAVFELHLAELPGRTDDYLRVQHAITASARAARNRAYDARRNRQISGSAEVYYVLDRRLNWSDDELREHAIECLRTGRRPTQNLGIPLWVVYSKDGNIFCVKLDGDANDEGALARLRQHELTSLVKADGVLFFHGRGVARFRLPSGEFSDYFLRIGNIQKSRRAVTTVCFWCLPFSQRTRHVICESWTVSTIAGELAQFLNVYWANAEHSWKVTSSYLEEYPQGGAADISVSHATNFRIGDSRHLRELLRREKDNRDAILFLISASASGRLLKEVRDISEDFSEVGSIRPLVLYSIGAEIEEDALLCDLRTYLEERGLRYRIEKIDNDESVPIIEVDPRTYIPNYRVTKKHPFSVLYHTKTDGFFERYSGNKIFSVNRIGRTSERSPGRHYSYHFDADKVLEHPAFTSGLDAAIAKVGSVTSVVAVDTIRNRRFCALVKEGFEKVQPDKESPPITFVHDFSSLSEESDLLADMRDPKGSILFADALVVTGSNIRDLSELIRKEASIAQGSKAKLTYLIGLARWYSSEKKKWVSFFNRASSHDGFLGCLEVVESVALPLFQEKNCPWMRELKAHEAAIQDLPPDSEERDFIAERISVLRVGRTEGLTGKNVFFQRYMAHEFPFWDGSLFLDRRKVVEENKRFGVTISTEDVDEADLVCATVAAVHQWRTEANKNEWLLNNQIDFDDPSEPEGEQTVPDEVTHGQTAFNEPMLRASIWRSLLPNELSFTKSGSDAPTLLSTVLIDHGNHGNDWMLGGEAALAFGWRVRYTLTQEQIEMIDWKYLLKLADTA